MIKRGRYNRPFLHISAIGVLVIGLVFSPLITETYPVFSQGSTESNEPEGNPQKQSIILGDNLLTSVSKKPRSEIITYRVQKGDTLSTIASKFGISVETIQWENDIVGESITVGDELKILPVTGVAHKVLPGDTVYTIAKRYDTNPQKIVDFTFNDFANPETFSLITGQIVFVPDGIPPVKQSTFIRPRPVYVVSGSTSVSSAGFAWPLNGGISQYASWYHMALDITSDVGTPIVAANSGVVTSASVGTYDGGYGNNVYIDGGDGIKTHYAHMSSVYVSSGQSVVAGKTVVGAVGLTGRTTGPHLHFEIYQNGVLVNPMQFLP